MTRMRACTITLLAVLLLSLTAPAASAVCWFNPDGSMYCTEAYPVYEAELTDPPNWCLYEGGDVVWVRYSTSGRLRIVAWYVYPWTHPNPERPDGYDPIPWFVYAPEVHCGIFQP